MDPIRPEWFPALFGKLLQLQHLNEDEAETLFRAALAGEIDEALLAAILTALRIKGESPLELAAAAKGVRRRMIPLTTTVHPVVDTCGTGGDDSGTFNISTGAALVAAAAGVAVVKHGNRAVSSRSGSADALRALDVPIEAGVDWATNCLETHRFAFCYAPHFHPVLAQVGGLRRKLGVRTIFNLLGPLANPAGAEFQLLGVGRPELLDSLAQTIALLGTQRTVLVSGADGLDEVTLATTTNVRIVELGLVRVEHWHPEDFGLEPVALSEIQARDANASATIIRAVLQGERCPAERIVLANAAATLWTAGWVATLPDGVALAREAIANGRALQLLAGLQSSAAEPESPKSQGEAEPSQ